MRIDRTGDIEKIRIELGGRLHSATHEEILDGQTTDIYFVRTRDILSHMGLLDTPVSADVFARKEGVLCGVEEVKFLLKDRGVEVLSLAEGELFEPLEPVMRINGKYSDFGMYETVILGMLSAPSAWATAAAECKAAAGGALLLCFGARHTHPAVAPVMERAALVGGADACSCILGALLAGKMPSGTIPHAAILIAGDTIRVAEAFDEVVQPYVPRVILVDTFKDEAEETLRLAHALKKRLHGIRLDTPSERGGVTPALVNEIRHRLDLEGFENVKIAVSGGINPDRIRQLKAAGADIFGTGSYISAAAPIDMTLDIKEINGEPIAKRGRIPGSAPSKRLKKILP